MEQVLAEDLSKRLQISIDNIVREYWEMFVLNELYASPLANVLIFKGGTALRFIYKSPRFSEDLDFSLLDKLDFDKFKKIIEKIVASKTELSIKEIYSKKYTYFALIKFKQDYLAQTLSIKVEVSKRKLQLKKDKDFKAQVAFSPTSNFKPLVKVFTLEKIFREKLNALSSRKKARDLFDIWFVGQLLHREKILFPKTKITEKEIKQELHRLLPKNYYPIVADLIKYAKAK